MKNCSICPRKCGADRSLSPGYCSQTETMSISKVMLHRWEEPCISGKGGSGAVFFDGCPLKCVFCQNKKISRSDNGEKISPEKLCDIILALQNEGADNINFVSPTHFTDGIIEALKLAKDRLHVPVVWNTSGYELEKTVERLRNYVDVFLSDFKYFSPDISKRYSSASDYFDRALPALEKMVGITGDPVFENGLLKRGVIVRHLVLPSCCKDSIRILETLAEKIGADRFLLSLMSQYTPEFLDPGYPELNRKLTTFEYEKVLSRAEELGFRGYMQEKSSATSAFTPDF